MKNFSQFAKGIRDKRILRVAEKLGKKFQVEFERRLNEVKEGRALTLYRPWDDK